MLRDSKSTRNFGINEFWSPAREARLMRLALLLQRGAVRFRCPRPTCFSIPSATSME